MRAGLRVIVVTLLAVAPARGQTVAADPFVIEQRVDARWLMEKQVSRITPFSESRTFITFTTRPAAVPGGASFTATHDRPAEPAQLDLRRDGSVAQVSATRPPIFTLPARGGRPAYTPNRDDSISFRLGRNSLTVPLDPSTGGGGRQFWMPEARVWELVPVIAIPALSIGARWTDTVSLSAAADESRQSLTGVRTSRVVGDTTVNGRRLWIVADSMSATVVEQFPEIDRSIGNWVTVERRATGIIRGRSLVDPVRRLAESRVDTAVLVGRVTVTYPDGHSVGAPARYDRRRTLTLLTPAEQTARVAALRLNPEVGSDRQAGRGAIPAVTPAAAESWFAAWEATTDPREASQLWARVSQSRVPSLLTKQQDRALALGDSTRFVQMSPAFVGRWDVPLLRDFIIPYHGDAGGALARGASRDAFYVTVTSALFEQPPAITDSAARPLAPAVYSYFANDLATATDQRLRDLSLVTRYLIDPKRWADTVIARGAMRPSAILEPAVLLAKGVGALWPETGQPPMPAPGADWRTWQRWIGLQRSGVGIVLFPLVTSQGIVEGPTLFTASHVRAIRMHEAQTGRAILQELRQNLANATDDSARTVWTTILRGAGGIEVTPDDLIADLRSGVANRVAATRQAIRDRITPPPGPPRLPAGVTHADSSTSVELVDRLMNIALGTGPAWRTIEQVFGTGGIPVPPAIAAAAAGRVNSVFISDSLPKEVVSRWSSRATIMSAAEYNALGGNDMRRVYRMPAITTTGPFAMARIEWSERLPPSTGGPAGHGGFMIFYLAKISGEWVIVELRAAAS